MCKVLMLTNSKNVKNFSKLVNTIQREITKHDDDGFGWVCQGPSGIVGERTLNDKHTYRLNKKLFRADFIKKTYEVIGDRTQKPIGAALFHGRTSTNNVSLINTHPISRDGFHLIHNGVVSNEGPEYEMKTTNDTEHLAHYLSTQGIESIEKYISGYFAIGAIGPDGTLHVAKCATAQLYATYITSIDSYVFGTTDDLIKTVCKKMGWKHLPCEIVDDNVYMTFLNNKQTSFRKIKTLGMKNSYQRDMMSTSLHYLNDFNSNDSIVDSIPNTDSVPDYNGYLDRIELEANSSWRFYFKDTQLDYSEFIRLQDTEKLQCDVYDDSGCFIEPVFFNVGNPIKKAVS